MFKGFDTIYKEYMITIENSKCRNIYHEVQFLHALLGNITKLSLVILHKLIKM